MRPWPVSVVSVSILVLAGSAWASPQTRIYKEVRSSVVIIQTTQKDIDPAMPGQAVNVEGLGSGVLISEDGKVLHAVDLPPELQPLAKQVRDTIYSIVDAGVNGDL